VRVEEVSDYYPEKDKAYPQHLRDIQSPNALCVGWWT
jgi:hypothetical protein